ncbi:hypothetical protein Hamer_G022340 [Homarus americanus]|uniref:Uncharacterized protein n=1 Tax=Homarus americanus TaxID=6706 RepID=A0A8J5JIZ8_HOMAM|nr:hypothetical protein Hamer_G022340 [Homarus americanus]
MLIRNLLRKILINKTTVLSCFAYSIVFDRSAKYFFLSVDSTASAISLAGYSYSQSRTTPLGYLQYNLTCFSPEDQDGWTSSAATGTIRP